MNQHDQCSIYTRHLSHEQFSLLQRQLQRVTELSAPETVEMFTLLYNSHLLLAYDIACTFVRHCQEESRCLLKTATMDAGAHERFCEAMSYFNMARTSPDHGAVPNVLATLTFLRKWFQAAAETDPEVVAATANMVLQAARAINITPDVISGLNAVGSQPSDSAIRNIVNSLIVASHGMSNEQFDSFIQGMLGVWPPDDAARIAAMVHQGRRMDGNEAFQPKEVIGITQLVKAQLHVSPPTETLVEKTTRAMAAVRSNAPLLGRPMINDIATDCKLCTKAVDPHDRFTFVFPLSEYAAVQSSCEPSMPLSKYVATVQSQHELSTEIQHLAKNDAAKTGFVSWTFHNACF